MEVKNDINNTLATAKRRLRPLNRGGRWIEVSNATVYWQTNRDFEKWPLNGGWPLNSGWTVFLKKSSKSLPRGQKILVQRMVYFSCALCNWALDSLFLNENIERIVLACVAGVKGEGKGKRPHKANEHDAWRVSMRIGDGGSFLLSSQSSRTVVFDPFPP